MIYATISVVIQENLRLMIITEEMPDYTAILLYRFVLVPMLVTWAVDIGYRYRWMMKTGTILVCTFLLAGLQFLFVKSGFIFYSGHWNGWYTAALFAVMIAIVEMLRKLFHQLLKSEVAA